MHIGIPQIEASYEIAKSVYQLHIAKEVGARRLHTEHGMNPGSARDYIKTFRCMMDGIVFTRTINAAAAEHYLSKILSDFGSKHLQAALLSLRLHIEYYEDQAKSTLHKLRKLIVSYASQLTVDGLNAKFNAEVESSRRDTSEERATRLKHAAKIPQKITVNMVYFVRNRDVVAEVLIRAAGVCGVCGANGPFQRKSDGTPYLEVHHKKQLADGGEDVVENAVAVCPNCHRKAHFGVDI